MNDFALLFTETNIRGLLTTLHYSRTDLDILVDHNSSPDSLKAKTGKGCHPYPLCHAYRQMDDKLFTYPPSLLIGSFQRRDKIFIVYLYRNLATLPRLSGRFLTHPPTIVHLPISVSKSVWMASLSEPKSIIQQ